MSPGRSGRGGRGGAGFERLKRDIDVYIKRTLSPDAARAIFIGKAGPILEEWRAAWAELTVPVELRADGNIVERVPTEPGPSRLSGRADLEAFALGRALELYDTFVKIQTGGYKSAGKIIGEPGGSGPVILTNVSAFARKAEHREFNDKESSGFSDGLFESIAVILKEELGKVVPVNFNYSDIGGRRLPALEIG